MNVLEFRKISLNDAYNSEYNDGYAWSRVYEYQLVIDMINKYRGYNKNDFLHNTSWGFEGIHIKFKNKLDELYENASHSDIKRSLLPKTFLMDITKEPLEYLVNYFDVVINVSTLEEVYHDHILIFNNLLKQVKYGGLLICTFDVPGLDLDKFENLFKIKLKTDENDLTNKNSLLKNIGNKTLSCGIMVIENKV